MNLPLLLSLALLSPGAMAKPFKQETKIKQLQLILGEYKKYCGQFPTTEQGLAALATKPDRGPPCENYPESAFIVGRKIPRDHWGRPYLYTSDGLTYTITSLGRDGKTGGKGVDADVVTKQ